MTKKSRVALLGGFSFVFAIALTTIFFGYQLFKKPVSDDVTEVIFEVQPGMTLSQISLSLEQNKLIRNAKAFQYYAQARGQDSRIKVGEYALSQALTTDKILAILVSGKSVARSFTIPEGSNIFDIAEVLSKNKITTKEEFLNLVTNPSFIQEVLGESHASLEGYLFPETYQYTKFESLEDIVKQMVKRFNIVWSQDIGNEKNKLNWTRHQIVTLASIVEKETGAAFERPLVASVFHNRLQKQMRLQTDPTVLYGMALQTKEMPTNITKNDLLTPTAYNTYTISGLPPGPIANPGREALLAVLNPAQSSYIYFVSQNNGTHVFSETLQQHNKAVQEYQLNAKARENKSWRDLNQKDK